MKTADCYFDGLTTLESIDSNINIVKITRNSVTQIWVRQRLIENGEKHGVDQQFTVTNSTGFPYVYKGKLSFHSSNDSSNETDWYLIISGGNDHKKWDLAKQFSEDVSNAMNSKVEIEIETST